MQLLTDEYQLTQHKMIITLVESVLHPGEYVWIWQTVEGMLREEYDIANHLCDFIGRGPRNE